MPPPPPASAGSATPSRPTVTAVLVVHDGGRWLAAALPALDAQTRAPDRVVIVDTGSVDESRALLAGRPVLRLPRDTGYGAAVGAALAAAPAAAPAVEPAAAGGAPERWVWLLHDDCAPQPSALEALLAAAAASPGTGVLGPKVRGWDDPGALIEIGLRTDRAGRRDTGLDRPELDQGQHDGGRPVLAVGTAAALVRRDVWDRLGGLDPALPLFRDDLDLGWRATLAGAPVLVVPAAVVHHAAALTAGRRRPDAERGPARRTSRRHELYLLAANLPLLSLLLALPRFAAGSLLRVLWAVTTGRPATARDEVLAVAGLLAHPLRLVRARLARRRSRILPARAARHLLVSRRARLRASGALLRDRVGGRAGAVDPGSARPVRPVPRLPRRSGLVLLLVPVVALVAERRLLGPGALVGGRLLAAPPGAADLWAMFTGGWHPVGVGSTAATPPYLVLLAGLAALLLGSAPHAVDVLLLGCVPLAALSAYAASRFVTRERSLRLLAAATYALLPVGTGAVAAGRLDVAAAVVLVPWVLSAGLRALAAPPYGGWRRGAVAALLLAVLAAFAPLLYLVIAPVLALAAAWSLLRAAGRRGRRAGGVLMMLAAPPLLLMPWTAELLNRPGPLLLGPGLPVPGLVAPGLRPVDLLLLHPGGPALPRLALTAPLLAAALAGAGCRRSLAAAGVLLATAGLVAAGSLARLSATPAAGGPGEPVWPGLPLVVAGAGMVLLALLAGAAMTDRLHRSSFGWRQPAAGLVLLALAGGPVAMAAGWVSRGADGPVQRRPAAVAPAFVTAALAQPDAPRLLVLHQLPDGRTGYRLLRGSAETLGGADLRPDPPAAARLAAAVRDLTAGAGGGGVAGLWTYGVRFVLLRPPAAAARIAVLDQTPGLTRVAVGDGFALWRVVPRTGRLLVLPPELAATLDRPAAIAGRLDRAGAEVLAPRGGRATVRPGPPGRLLVLAEPVTAGWRVSLDGRPLPRRVAWGWAPAFGLPARGGALTLRPDLGARRRALTLPAALLGVLVLLALPLGGRPPTARPARPPAPGPGRPAAADRGARPEPEPGPGGEPVGGVAASGPLAGTAARS